MSRSRRRAPCPVCSREVSVSSVDPLHGPDLWRAHNNPQGAPCLDPETGSTPRRYNR